MHQPPMLMCWVAVSTAGSPAIGLQWTLIPSCFDALLVLLQQLHQRSHLGRNNLMKARKHEETWTKWFEPAQIPNGAFFKIKFQWNRWFFWSFERREWEYFHVDLLFIAHCEIKWFRPWLNAFPSGDVAAASKVLLQSRVLSYSEATAPKALVCSWKLREGQRFGHKVCLVFPTFLCNAYAWLNANDDWMISRKGMREKNLCLDHEGALRGLAEVAKSFFTGGNGGIGLCSTQYRSLSEKSRYREATARCSEYKCKNARL